MVSSAWKIARRDGMPFHGKEVHNVPFATCSDIRPANSPVSKASAPVNLGTGEPRRGESGGHGHHRLPGLVQFPGVTDFTPTPLQGRIVVSGPVPGGSG